MRLSTKLGASMSAAALGSAVVLGGAGVAQASSGSLGSNGSLGSSDPAPVTLTVAGDTEGVGGEITNNTEGTLTCGVVVSDAEVISAVQDDFGGDVTLDEAFAENDEALQAANAEGKNALAAVEVAAGETEEWTGIGGYGPEEDFRAGAAADCDDQVAFAYEADGAFGSLDMGSLQS